MNFFIFIYIWIFFFLVKKNNLWLTISEIYQNVEKNESLVLYKIIKATPIINYEYLTKQFYSVEFKIMVFIQVFSLSSFQQTDSLPIVSACAKISAAFSAKLKLWSDPYILMCKLNLKTRKYTFIFIKYFIHLQAFKVPAPTPSPSPAPPIEEKSASEKEMLVMELSKQSRMNIGFSSK